MHIVFQHPIPLPVQKYGGTERILFWIMRYLAKQGHQVDFIGPKESTVSEYGINHIIQTNKDWRVHLPENFDCLHLFYPMDLGPSIPAIFTVGGNGKPGEIFPKNTVFVSKSHANNHNSDTFVYNGIDLSEYPFELNPRPLGWKNFLFLAKGSWSVKNLKGCIKYTKAANKHLHIAGGRSLWSFVDPRIHSYGMVTQKEKEQIITQCDALLFPVLWNEPFGLAIIEAMAYGLPAIGFPNGSLPELIIPGTGLIGKNEDEIIQFLLNDEYAKQFDRLFIRSYVEQNFSHVVMAENYLKLYKKVAQT